MPHLILEFSENVREVVVSTSLLEKLHRALGETESFELDRIKSRAVELQSFVVGNRGEESALVHATVVFSRGRSEPVRRVLGERLLAMLPSGGGNGSLPISRSVEIRQFEEGMYFRG